MGQASCFPESKSENVEEAQRYMRQGHQHYRDRAYQQAVDAYSTAIDYYSKDPQIYIYRGNAHARLRDYRKSCEDYSAALRLDGLNATALSRRSQCYKQLGNLEAALDDAELACKVDNSPQNKDDLAKLRLLVQSERLKRPAVSPRAGAGSGGGRQAMAQQMQGYADRKQLNQRAAAAAAPRRAPGPAASPEPPLSPKEPQGNAQRGGAGEEEEILQNLQFLRARGLYEEDIHARRRQQVLGAKEPFTLDVPMQEAEKQWYDFRSKQWRKQQVFIRLDTKSFSEGAMRAAYRMIDTSRPLGQQCCVAKMHKKPPSDPGLYYVEVEMQAVCQALADAFNANERLQKKVKFVDAYLMMLKGDPGQPLCKRLLAVEPYIDGRYTKYNNNYGYVSYNDRNTPQAFSHFTYDYTKEKVMVVDIQGVGDIYTDPQIHTNDGRGYGKGNMGMEGIEKFFSTHRCNDICRYLKLQPRLGQLMKMADTIGTGAPPPGEEGFVDDFQAEKFVRQLLPKTDYARPEELAFLKLTRDQFNSIAAIFRHFDPAERGSISRSQLPLLLRELNFPANGDTSRLGTSPQVTFIQFLVFWTGLK